METFSEDGAMQNFRTLLHLTFSACLIVTLTSTPSTLPYPLYAAEGEEKLEIRVSPDVVYEGESTKLTVSVSNVKLNAEPSLEYLQNDFSIDPLEPTRRSNIRIVNSVSTENYTTDYNYRLTPKRTGVITIPPPEIDVEGKKLQASPIKLIVREKSKTDLAFLEAETSAKTPIYPFVSFEVSVVVYLKANPPKFDEYDPLSLVVHNLDAPLLSIPWLESRIFDDNLVADSLEDWLTGLSSKDYGFALNNYQQSKSIFDFSFSFFDEPARKSFFLPKPEKVTRPDSSGKNVTYWKYAFTRKMRATAPSTFSFTPSTLKGNFLDFADPETPMSQPIFLSSNPLSVQVQEIPEKNAPSNYVGIYGNVKQHASLSTNKAAVGDAITFTLAYVGYGSFTSASAPDISELEGIKNIFRVYPPSERSIESGVAFDYKLRPLKEGTYEFPSIKTSFFNVESGQFESMESSASQFVANTGILGSQDETLAPEKNVQSSENDGDSLDDAGKRQHKKLQVSATTVSYVAAISTLLISFLFAGRYAFRFYAKRVASSNRRILNSAQKTLELGVARFDSNPIEGFSLMRAAFLQLVGKRLRRPLDSYTDTEILSFLDVEFAKEMEKNSKSSETILKLKEFFKQSEKIRFGGVSLADVDFKKNVVVLFDRWKITLLNRTHRLSTLAYEPHKQDESNARNAESRRLNISFKSENKPK